MDRAHLVFKLDFTGPAREIKSEATIIDPLTRKSFAVTKAVWDTGATASAIRQDLVTHLGLKPIGITNVHTAGGITQAGVYLIDVQLPNGLTVGQNTVTAADLGPETELLIGMDIISHGDFILQNDKGKTQFCFCWPPMEKKYGIWQLANAHNLQLAKKNAKKKR